MQSSVGRCEAAGCDVAVFLLTRLVCTKTTGFLFVKIRRESRTRYEYFCEEERERYVAFGKSDAEASVWCAEVHSYRHGARRDVLSYPGRCFRVGPALFASALFRWPTPRSVP